MNNGESRKVAFGDFELDLATGDLTREGKAVRLAAQPTRALLLLVGRAGELVLRGEIQQHVWGDLVIEQEQGLNTCVRQIRSALGDRPDTPRFIETVPRRGYRFIAAVHSIGLREPAPPPKTFTPSPPVRGLQMQQLFFAIAVLICLILLPVWLRQKGTRVGSLAASPAGQSPMGVQPPMVPSTDGRLTSSSVARRTMLAVVPFKSLGETTEERAFALGLTTEVTTELTRLDWDDLGVIARGSIEATTGSASEVDFGKISQELGVDVVLQGSIQQVGDRMRIAVSLIRTSDHSHLWAERYDRHLGDVLDVQLEVAGQVARVLALELLPQCRSRLKTEPQAWEAYLRGRYLLDAHSPPNIEKARQELRRALELDPGLAQAHVALADAHHAERRSGTVEAQREELMRALEIDPDLAMAHLRLAKIQFYADWNFAGAESSYEQAVELAPGDAEVLLGYAVYLSHLRRHEEAIEHAERARQLDPISATVHSASGQIFFAARRYERAVEVCMQTVELSPGNYEARMCLLHAFRRLGRAGQAKQQALGLMRLLGADAESLRKVDQEADHEIALRNFFEWQVSWLRRNPVPPVSMAAAVLPLGRIAEVFHWLERAYEQRSGNLLAIAGDPRADAFREDPRFVDLLKRIGFPAETIER